MIMIVDSEFLFIIRSGNFLKILLNLILNLKLSHFIDKLLYCTFNQNNKIQLKSEWGLSIPDLFFTATKLRVQSIGW
jgi:hypothetical protein